MKLKCRYLAIVAAIVLDKLALGAGGPVPVAPAKSIPREISEPEFLWAIAAKETGNRPEAIGPQGERSQYQFTRETWTQHTDVPFMRASSDDVLADIVASQHFDWLQQRLHAARIPVTVRTMAAAWNYGPKFAKICADSAYAREVENLYAEEVRK